MAEHDNAQAPADDLDSKVLDLAKKIKENPKPEVRDPPPEKTVRNVSMGMAADMVQSTLSHLPGIKHYGRNNLFEFLRTKEVLHTRGDLWNVAKWEYIHAGLFDTAYVKRVEHTQTHYKLTTFVTPNGLAFIADLVEKELLEQQPTPKDDAEEAEPVASFTKAHAH